MTGRGLKGVTHGAGTGYGDAACAYLAGLDNLGIPVSWQPVDASPDVRGTAQQFVPNVPEAIRPTLNGLWQRAIEYDTVLLSLPPCAGTIITWSGSRAMPCSVMPPGNWNACPHRGRL